jgi:hypothetical protein
MLVIKEEWFSLRKSSSTSHDISLATCNTVSLTLNSLKSSEYINQKWIEKGTIYKSQCNFLCPLYSFPQKRIIGQVLIGSINSLHEHIILRNAKRLLFYLFMSPWKSEMISSTWRESFFIKRFRSCAMMHQVLTDPDA